MKNKHFLTILIVTTFFNLNVKAQDTTYYFVISGAVKVCDPNELKEESILYTLVLSCICDIDSLYARHIQWQKYALSNLNLIHLN